MLYIAYDMMYRLQNIIATVSYIYIRTYHPDNTHVDLSKHTEQKHHQSLQYMSSLCYQCVCVFLVSTWGWMFFFLPHWAFWYYQLIGYTPLLYIYTYSYGQMQEYGQASFSQQLKLSKEWLIGGGFISVVRPLCARRSGYYVDLGCKMYESATKRNNNGELVLKFSNTMMQLN